MHQLQRQLRHRQQEKHHEKLIWLTEKLHHLIEERSINRQQKHIRPNFEINDHNLVNFQSVLFYSSLIDD